MVDSYNVKEESTNEETDKSLVYEGTMLIIGICGIIGGITYTIGRRDGLAAGYKLGAVDAFSEIMKALR